MSGIFLNSLDFVGTGLLSPLAFWPWSQTGKALGPRLVIRATGAESRRVGGRRLGPPGDPGLWSLDFFIVKWVSLILVCLPEK